MAWTERYVRADAAGSGDGTTDTNSGANGAWTLDEAISNYAAGHRVNIKAGTYSISADKTFSTSGSATAPVWFRGFNTTIGDIDSDNTLTKPLLSHTACRVRITGSNIFWSNIRNSGTYQFSGLVRLEGSRIQFWRNRVENTQANSASTAIDCVGTNIKIALSWLKATSTAGSVVNLASSSLSLLGSSLHGGVDSLEVTGSFIARLAAHYCIFDDPTTHCIHFGSSSFPRGLSIIGNSFYSPGTDGIRLDAVDDSSRELSNIIGNIFSAVGGSAVNNNSGANISSFLLAHNLFHSITGSNYANFGDTPSFGDVTDGSTPFEDAAADDFTIVDASNGRGAGFPGSFEAIG